MHFVSGVYEIFMLLFHILNQVAHQTTSSLQSCFVLPNQMIPIAVANFRRFICHLSPGHLLYWFSRYFSLYWQKHFPGKMLKQHGVGQHTGLIRCGPITGDFLTTGIISSIPNYYFLIHLKKCLNNKICFPIKKYITHLILMIWQKCAENVGWLCFPQA